MTRRASAFSRGRRFMHKTFGRACAVAWLAWVAGGGPRLATGATALRENRGFDAVTGNRCEASRVARQSERAAGRRGGTACLCSFVRKVKTEPRRRGRLRYQRQRSCKYVPIRAAPDCAKGMFVAPRAKKAARSTKTVVRPLHSQTYAAPKCKTAPEARCATPGPSWR